MTIERRTDQRLTRSKSLRTFIFLTTFLLGVCIPLRAVAGEKEIDDLFSRLEKTISSGEFEKASQFYSDKNSGFLEEQKRKLNNLSALGELKCEISPTKVTINSNRAEAILFYRISFKLNNRVSALLFWTTADLTKDKNHWKISAEEERDFIDPLDTKLDISISPEKGLMSGKARINYRALLPSENSLTIKLNRGLEISKLTDSKGKKLSYERYGNVIHVQLDHYLYLNEVDTVNIEYSGELFNETKERGYSQVTIDSTGSFASWVTWWYPTIDNGTSKSAGTITYKLPKGLKVASSGLFKGIQTIGNQEVHTFKVTQPLNFSFAAAKYFHKRKMIKGIEVSVYFLEGGEKKARFYINQCSKMISFFKSVYGFYPYDKYAVVELWKDKVGTLGGSSEQGMNLFPTGILPEDDSLEFIIAHEIGHSWWGNLVGGGFIISEALAQYSAALWIEHKYGYKMLLSLLENGMNTGSSQNSYGYFHDLAKYPESDLEIGIDRPDKGNDLHALADNKGYFVYQMLRDQIGKDNFLEGLKNVLEKYKHKSVELKELQKEMEATSGQELDWFFEQWCYRTGAPEFVIAYQTDKVTTGYKVSGSIEQKREVYAVNAEIGMLHRGEYVTKEIEIKDKTTKFEFITKNKPEDVLFDPFYKILRWTPERRNIGSLLAASRLMAVNQFEQAEALIQDRLTEAPGSLRLNLMLGNIHLKSKNFAAAQTQFSKVIQLHQKYRNGYFSPEVGASLLSLGNVSDLQGKRKSALKFYKKLLKSAVIIPHMKVAARKFIDEEFVLPKPFIVTKKQLKLYEGTYELQGMSFAGTVDKDGILSFKGTDGRIFDLAPTADDKFALVGNETMMFEFPKNTQGQYNELAILKNDQLLVTLKKSNSHK